MRLLRALTVAATLLLVVAAGRFGAGPLGAQKRAGDYPVQPVPFTSVRLNDVFWTPRIETNRKVTIPAAFRSAKSRGA